MSSPTTPSSGSRLTTGQQISARSQYGPTTGTTSSSTNRRTVMKCDHCSSVNCSRTEKKSVPRDSPRCALVTCVIAGFLSGLALRGGGAGVEKRLHDRSDVFGVCGQLEVAAVVDMQLASGYQPVHDPRVDQRDDRVVVTGQDQGGPSQPRQPRQAGPAGPGEQLVVVTPGRAQAGRPVQQVTGHGRVAPRAAAVQLPGDAGRVPRVPVTPRGEHAQQDARVRGDHQRACPG